ncbi:MAG TPA: DUF4012 domain-containing protein [bacterium]|nr:DUF4012 domain-containing protein [bacterium]
MNNIFKKIFLKSSPGLSRSIIIVIVLGVISFIFLIGLIFFRIRTVYLNVLSGRQDLDYALTFVKEGDFSRASVAAERAVDGFTLAEEILTDLQNNFLIKRIGLLNNNLNDFKYLAQMARVLSSSAEKSLTLVQEIEDIVSGKKAGNFLEFTEDEKFRILKKLYESYPEMQGIKANIDLSLIYLDKVKGNRLLSSYSNQIENLEIRLKETSVIMEKIVSLSAIVPVLTGYPESASYLIVLQNNNELRPTGGFIGTYGILEIKLGDIVKLETHDIYHLDMPASLNKSFQVSPPEPIAKYLGVNQWFMRDSNWSPDWPTSAKKILWFYEQEMLAAGKGNEIIDFSGVIAVTPRIITDLLYIVGPIEIDGQVYDKDNFMDVLQYEVEMAFREEGVSEWDRKLVIGSILKELKVKLFNLSSNRWVELLDLFNKNIQEKNALVYLDDEYSRKISTNLGWDGEIKKSSQDYLMTIDANLAAYKTDRVMEKNIKYTLNEEANGKFKAIVKIEYKNNGFFDWQTTRYRTFTRVYVPLDSALLNSSGLSVSPAISDKDIEIANPKTYFGGFILIEPGKQGTLTFEYYLPEKISQEIKANNIYSLLLQKQPGNNINKFEAEFNFINPIKSASGDGSIRVEKNKIYWDNNLEKDYYLEIKF